MFSMGRGLGIWDGIIGTFQSQYSLLAYTRVPVVRWKREMLPSAEERASKAGAVARARQLWPALRLKDSEHGIADAALIAEYGRRLMD